MPLCSHPLLMSLQQIPLYTFFLSLLETFWIYRLLVYAVFFGYSFVGDYIHQVALLSIDECFPLFFFPSVILLACNVSMHSGRPLTIICCRQTASVWNVGIDHYQLSITPSCRQVIVVDHRFSISNLWGPKAL